MCDSGDFLPNLVRRRLDEMGWSLPELACRARLGQATLEALLDPAVDVVPRRVTLVQLARGLGLPAEQVIAASAANPLQTLGRRDRQLVDAIRGLDEPARTMVEIAAQQLQSPDTVAAGAA